MGRRAPAVALIGLIAACDSTPPPVRISELHYHPVLEDDYVERHEFIEIYNAGADAVDLAGWTLAGDTVTFEIPAGATLAAGEYRVIAKDRAALAVVWGLDPATVIGDYAGELDNGKDTIRLLDGGGREADAVEYDDDFPWPVGADALGAGEKWLPPELLPVDAHRYKGHSLERVSFDIASTEVANWVPSPLDGSTPGRVNAASAVEPPAIATGLARVAVSTDDELAATFSAAGALAAVELEWFVDDVGAVDEPVTRVAMTDAGGRRFTALVPAVAEGTVVRYRVLADRGAGSEVISPRPTDPYRWHAYATTPVIATTTKTYHLYLAPSAWGRMWTNVAAGRDAGCTLNPTWNDEVPAVLLHDGEVYDALVRYQGSRYNRTNGRPIPSWPYPGPDAGPSPPLALSWHISFPRYRKLDGRGDLTLNKNSQGCPGYDAGVGFQLYQRVGVPAPDVNYARLQINGGYYHYMLEIERPGEEMMAKWGEVGDLFKSVGGAEDVAYGWGDERALGPNCGLTAAERYTLTYDRKTHTSWGKQDELIRLIEDLNAARAAGVAAERAFFAERFDLELLLNHMAVMNWSVPFDDMFQNHFLYLRRDGKWLLMPWDLDLVFGSWKPANASLYIGAEGDPDNRSGWWNVLKDSFLRAYRVEFDARLRAMVDGVLSPAMVDPIIDAWTAGADAVEAAAAPAGLACDFPTRAASFKQFVIDRAAVVKSRIP